MYQSSINSSIPDSPSHYITNVTFESNVAFIGGAIYISNVDYILITNSTFISNYAKLGIFDNFTGYGGAISYTASNIGTLLELDSTVVFQSNLAESSGGAIHWSYNEPESIELPQYINNTALLYGDNIACFAQNLIQKVDTENRNLRVLSSYSGNESLSLESQQSGGFMPDLYLSLVDKYGQILGSDSSSSAILTMNTSDVPTSFTPVISGASTVIARSGIFTFEDISFRAEPGITYNLYIFTTAIDTDKPTTIEYLSKLEKDSATMDLKVSLRYCIEGEAFLLTGE